MCYISGFPACMKIFHHLLFYHLDSMAENSIIISYIHMTSKYESCWKSVHYPFIRHLNRFSVKIKQINYNVPCCWFVLLLYLKGPPWYWQRCVKFLERDLIQWHVFADLKSIIIWKWKTQDTMVLNLLF